MKKEAIDKIIEAHEKGLLGALDHAGCGVYRSHGNPKWNRCPIGALIPDTAYRSSMEGMYVHKTEIKPFIKAAGLSVEQALEMQQFHDLSTRANIQKRMDRLVQGLKVVRRGGVMKMGDVEIRLTE